MNRLLLASLLAACNHSPDTDSAAVQHTSTPGETDSAVETDSETDSDSETETDSETGPDSETETDSETDTQEPWPAGEATGMLDCEIADPEGLAVRLWWPDSAEARHVSTAPVLVRVGGANWIGWDLGHDPQFAVDNGAVVVQFLRPGTESSDGWASGGEDDKGGPSVRHALRCVLDLVAGERALDDGALFSDHVPFGGVVVATGLSMGGNHVSSVLVDDPSLPPAAVVLWESPLTDQITLQEMSPLGSLDPRFEPGSCTLDEGCPFPGRAALLRWDGSSGVLFTDEDEDGIRGADELYYRPLVDESEGVSYFSEYMLTEVRGNVLSVFAGGMPAWWPGDEQAAAWWADWVATERLIRIRDEGDARAWWVLGSGSDHAQLVHEHLRLAQLALRGAAFFRLNGDASYTQGLGDPSEVEFDANTLLLDPDHLAALPDPRGDVQVLGAELEAADRVQSEVWDADLESPLFPVISLLP